MSARYMRLRRTGRLPGGAGVFLRLGLIFTIALCPFAGRAAVPELACSTYLTGVAGGDAEVVNTAADIAKHLIDSTVSTPAMDKEQAAASSPKTRRDLVLRQLSRDCGMLPRESINGIVLVHLHAQ